jgi:hypothetical protein
VALVALLFPLAAGAQPIDRKAVVTRHNVTVTTFDPLSPLSVGNGDFAFTVDPTGLQTFPQMYEKEDQTPLCTMAQWGWHTIPKPAALEGQEYKLTMFNVYGRQVGYQTSQSGPLATWLRENPHRLHLGRIGLILKKADGSDAAATDLQNVSQTLDLWSGIITSRFDLEGSPVIVTTACAGANDAVAAKVESPLLASGRVKVIIAFPYGSPGRPAANWNKPEAHKTAIDRRGDHSVAIARTLDDDHYNAQLDWTGTAALAEAGPHTFELSTTQPSLQVRCSFSPDAISAPTGDGFDQSRDFWQKFWMSGGAIDLSGSTDPRWKELERRIVLSEYQTRINCAAIYPPAETGLVYNSWYGKFHLEMHWWHVAHFSFWNRQDLFEKSMPYYQSILPAARKIAQTQGYLGARWPKMTDPSGRDSPSGIGPLLIWQEPHPIYYAELCYRAHPDRKTLEQWQQVVEESAEFMVSYAAKDPQTGKYNLGPPLKTVPEHNDTNTTKNPTFELSQWRMGLRMAQQWRERLGQARNPAWDEVLNNLAPLPQENGLYISQEGLPNMWTEWNWEHPSLIGAYGVLPGDAVDPVVMKATLEKVMEVWKWDECWVWDFPMAAMAAAKVGRPDLAINALLIDSPKNRYLPSGHVYQRPNLTLYLPGNGGLLSAVALMAAGWDGGPNTPAPGFPREGWVVRYENLSKVP